MPKISILIPAYNVEQYIARCLDSVTGQTFGDIEIIIVNDGSTDGTRAIMEGYASRDPRIRLIDHPGNCGLLWVRKTCIEASSGKYLMFVDSDDEITSDACEILYSEAEGKGADMVIAGHDWIMVSGKADPVVNELKYGGSSYGVAKAMVMNELKWCLWGKLYRRELFTDHPVTFLKHFNVGEDQVLSWQIVRYVSNAVCIPDRIYKYYQNTSSIISSFGSDKDLRNSMVANQFSVKMAGEIDGWIKEKAETNAVRTFFNLIKKGGFSRDGVMALVGEYGFSSLFSLPSLLRHLGFRKALMYHAVTHYDIVPWLLYRKGRKK